MGLIGVGGEDGVGVVGGLIGVCGVVMVIQPGPTPSASAITRIREMTMSFKFVLFITIYIITYQVIVKILLRNASPLSAWGRGGWWGQSRERVFYAAGISGN